MAPKNRFWYRASRHWSKTLTCQKFGKYLIIFSKQIMFPILKLISNLNKFLNFKQQKISENQRNGVDTTKIRVNLIFIF